MANKRFWLVKQEPEKYSWHDLLKESVTSWTGVRNFQARNNLAAMKKGDKVLFYHSVSEKQIIGIAEVARESYPDPTADEQRWLTVDLKPVQTIKNPIPLAAIREHPELGDISLVKQSRLSVMPLSEGEFKALLKLGR
jgi:predicted RNA-binding protein with PUA-like domain